MRERWPAELGSFELWTEFGNEARRYDGLAGARFRFLRRRSLAASASRIEDLIAEIDLRYHIVMTSLFSIDPGFAGSHTPPLAQCLATAWLELLDAARTTTDPRQLPGALWSACRKEAGHHADSFKPRFMLRAYVDAMPAGDERGLVRLLAYGRAAQPTAETAETRRCLEQGCALLHQALLEGRMDVTAWTDGAFTPALILGLSPPYSEYLAWLFGAGKDDGS